jgi:hypothetical protein
LETLSDRQQQLLEWLGTARSISLEAIEERFGISVATAYRDVHALVAAGLAVKTSRGVRLAPLPETAPETPGRCFFCGGAIKDRTMFMIEMQDGSRRSACCSHCGLIALAPEMHSALARDFLYGRMVNVRQASFLLGSSINICCEPSVLCFANEGEAGCFQLGFGGQVYPFEGALARVKQASLLNQIKPGE